MRDVWINPQSLVNRRMQGFRNSVFPASPESTLATDGETGYTVDRGEDDVNPYYQGRIQEIDGRSKERTADDSGETDSIDRTREEDQVSFSRRTESVAPVVGRRLKQRSNGSLLR